MALVMHRLQPHSSSWEVAAIDRPLLVFRTPLASPRAPPETTPTPPTPLPPAPFRLPRLVLPA